MTKLSGCGPKLFIENEDIVSALHCLTLHSIAVAMLHVYTTIRTDFVFWRLVQNTAQHCTAQPSGAHCARVLFPLLLLLLTGFLFLLLPPFTDVSTLTFLSLPRLQLPTLMHRLHQAPHLKSFTNSGCNSIEDCPKAIGEISLPLPRAPQRSLVSSAHEEAEAAEGCLGLLATCCDLPYSPSPSPPHPSWPSCQSCSACR